MQEKKCTLSSAEITSVAIVHRYSGIKVEIGNFSTILLIVTLTSDLRLGKNKVPAHIENILFHSSSNETP